MERAAGVRRMAGTAVSLKKTADGVEALCFKLEDGKPAGEQNLRTELPELFKQIDLNEQQQQQLDNLRFIRMEQLWEQ